MINIAFGRRLVPLDSWSLWPRKKFSVAEWTNKRQRLTDSGSTTFAAHSLGWNYFTTATTKPHGDGWRGTKGKIIFKKARTGHVINAYFI